MSDYISEKIWDNWYKIRNSAFDYLYEKKRKTIWQQLPVELMLDI